MSAVSPLEALGENLFPCLFQCAEYVNAMELPTRLGSGLSKFTFKANVDPWTLSLSQTPRLCLSLIRVLVMMLSHLENTAYPPPQSLLISKLNSAFHVA